MTQRLSASQSERLLNGGLGHKTGVQCGMMKSLT
ncbi:MAG: hypothetical protein JWN98_1233, partial [Abditibacteriota bacterium]|nr:hypothetical protein [Abditibacteriota bacterium]